jgi:Tol biopolymer transport system component
MAYVQNLTDFDLWRIQPGKPPQTFASSTRDERSPHYSPDGKRVAFQSNRSGSMNVWVCDADGKNAVQLTNFSEFAGTPRWSPDSQWIAFDRHLKSGWHIFVMASDGGHVRQLTSDQGDEVIPSWSRDGNWIYFASNRTSRFEVWKAPSHGGKGQQVTRHGGWVASEAPDGRSLYYTKIPENLSMSNRLWELPADGTEERLVATGSIFGRAYTVTEDGIYYISVPAAGGRASIEFHSFSTGNNQEVTTLDGVAFGISVSPDRSSKVIATPSRTGSNVMVVEDFK